MSPRAIDIDELGNMVLVEGISFGNEPPQFEVSDLQVGDVLVWYASEKHRVSAAIREASCGPYSHVGIYIGDGESVDAGPHGVAIGKVIDLQHSFSYGRVMRYPSLSATRGQTVACAAKKAVGKGYAWRDAITLPLRRAAAYASNQPFWKRPLLAFPGAILLAKRKTPDPATATTTFCSRMVLEAYFAAEIYQAHHLQECVLTPNDMAAHGDFKYVGWLNHIAPDTPKWHPMDPYSPEPIRNSYAKWRRNFLRILTGSANHK